MTIEQFYRLAIIVTQYYPDPIEINAELATGTMRIMYDRPIDRQFADHVTELGFRMIDQQIFAVVHDLPKFYGSGYLVTVDFRPVRRAITRKQP